jgi:hypothetical protein
VILNFEEVMMSPYRYAEIKGRLDWFLNPNYKYTPPSIKGDRKTGKL